MTEGQQWRQQLDRQVGLPKRSTRSSTNGLQDEVDVFRRMLCKLMCPLQHNQVAHLLHLAC